MAEHKWREIGPIGPMPEVGDRVLIVIDVRAWDKKRPRRIEIAHVGSFENPTQIGGPHSLTGYTIIVGKYFSIPAILHPDSVTHWKPLPELPLPIDLPF